jgi:hypothetical protein
MPITYTNRKGTTFHLCQSTTKTGKPRYYFAREQKAAPVEQIPEGFRISESANGLVSLERDRPSQIRPDEVALIEAEIARRPKPRNFHVAVKRDWVEISERLGLDVDGMAADLGRAFGAFPSVVEQLRSRLEASGHFGPALRFNLIDADRRRFYVQRWCSLGSIDDWIDVGLDGPLNRIAAPAIARLGEDAFYDPFWASDAEY